MPSSDRLLVFKRWTFVVALVRTTNAFSNFQNRMARPYKRSGGVSRRRVASAKAIVARARQTLYKRNRGNNYRSSGYIGRFTGKAGELKFYDEAFAFTGIGTSGNFVSALVTPAAGTGPENRIGRKITLKKLHIRLAFKNVHTSATSGAQTADMVRCLVIQDTQCNGSAVTATSDLFQNPASGALIRAFNNLENSGRFKTLYDKTIDMNAQVGGAYGAMVPVNVPAAAGGNQAAYTVPANTDLFLSGESVKHRDVYLNNLSIPLEYKGTTGAVTELTSNNIFMFFVSQESHTQVAAQWRARFEDA